jgi:hypothetical protein
MFTQKVVYSVLYQHESSVKKPMDMGVNNGPCDIVHVASKLHHSRCLPESAERAALLGWLCSTSSVVDLRPRP